MFQKRSLTRALVLTAVLFIAGCAGWSCTTGTATLKVQSATVDALLLTNETAKLVAATFDGACPRNAIFTLDQCIGWRHFAEGRSPADAICKAPTFLNLVDVQKKCGFKVAYPVAIRAYQEGKETLASVGSAIELLIRGTRDQAAVVNAAMKR